MKVKNNRTCLRQVLLLIINNLTDKVSHNYLTFKQRYEKKIEKGLFLADEICWNAMPQKVFIYFFIVGRCNTGIRATREDKYFVKKCVLGKSISSGAPTE